MAPEIIELKGTCIQSDIWSIGSTIIELMTGEPPYFKCSPFNGEREDGEEGERLWCSSLESHSFSAMHKIVEDPPPKLAIPHTPHLQDFLSRCLVKDPRKRPSAAQLLRHPWITADRLPIPPNAMIPYTVALADLFEAVKADVPEEEDDESSDYTSESEEEEEEAGKGGSVVAGAVAAAAAMGTDDDESDDDDDDEEAGLTEAQRDIRNFHKEFDELIVWLNRALDQHNAKQARRLCETIEKRDKPLRAKYTDHPDAKGLLDALNKVMSRYYKVSAFLFVGFFLLFLQEVEGAVGTIKFKATEEEEEDESSDYDSEEESEEEEEGAGGGMDMFAHNSFIRGI